MTPLTVAEIDFEDVTPRLWGPTEIVDGPIADSPCWERRRSIDPTGYTKIAVNGYPRWSHRVSWMLQNDRDIPAGMHVMHLCDNRLCVRPDHLTLGTPADNVHDAIAKGRFRTGRADPGPTCKRGHDRRLYTGRFPSKRTKSGFSNYCLRCHADRQNARYHAARVTA